jgi:hypothetical protein
MLTLEVQVKSGPYWKITTGVTLRKFFASLCRPTGRWLHDTNGTRAFA